MEDLAQYFGNPVELDNELKSFRKTARRLSSDAPRMIERYNRKWVALHSGRVRAHGESFEVVMAEIDSKGYSRKGTIIRYITDEPRTLLL